MKLRRGHVARVAGIADHLTLGDIVAAIDDETVGMRVGRDIAVVVLDEHEVAVALQLVAGIADRAGGCGVDRRAFGHGDVDAVIAPAIRGRAVVGDHAAAKRPGEGKRRRAVGRVFDRRRGRREIVVRVPAGFRLGLRRRAVEVRLAIDVRLAAMHGLGRGAHRGDAGVALRIPVELRPWRILDASRQERADDDNGEQRGRALNFDLPEHVRSRTSRQARQHRDEQDGDQDFFLHARLSADDLG